MISFQKNMRFDKFIEKVSQIVLDNLSNEQFGVESLAKIYGISRSQLFKKIKRTTGKSTSQFIRDIKLEKAIIQLKDDEVTVSQVAYNVGFSSHAYFATCFKDYFGYSPSEVKIREIASKNISQSNAYRSKDSAETAKRIWILSGSLLISFIFLGALLFNSLGKSRINNEKTIAVLRFVNLTDDESNQNFADGLAEEILNSLSKIKQIKVSSRTSAFQFDKNDDINKISKLLNVNYVLEGSVRKENNMFRVTTQLIDAADGDYHIWSETYDRKENDILFLQEEISRIVANELEVKLTTKEDEAMAKRITNDSIAYRLYNQGVQIAKSNKIEDVQKGLELVNLAIEADSTFALGHARLAQLYEKNNFFGDIGWKETNQLMQYHIEKAFKLDPELTEAYISNGYLEKRKSNFNKSRNSFEKAIELSPNDARAHYAMAGTFTVENRKQRYEEFLKAFELDPLNPSISLMVGQYYYFVKKDYTKAKEILNNSIKAYPKNDLATYHLAYYNSAIPKGDLAGTFKAYFEKYKNTPDERRALNWLFLASSWLDLKPVCDMLNNQMRLRYPTNIHTLWNMYTNNAINGRFAENVALVNFWKDNQDLKKYEAINYIAESYINGNKPNLAKKIIEDSIPEIKSEYFSLEGQIYHGITSNKLDVTEKYIIALKELNQTAEADKIVNLTVSYIDNFLEKLEIDQAMDYRVVLYLKLVKASVTDDLEMFIKVFGDAFFNDNHKVWMYDDLLIRARCKRFKNHPEFILFLTRVKEDIDQQRAEVVTYLKAAGHWETTWDKR